MIKSKNTNKPTSSFAGIDSATPDGNKKKLGEGEHLIEIEDCQLIDGFYGLTYVIECQVVESSNPENPPGSDASITITGLGDRARHESAVGRVKSFLAAVLGLDVYSAIPCDGETWESLADGSVSPSQPFAGEKLRATGYKKPTKNIDAVTGQPYQFMVWSFSAV